MSGDRPRGWPLWISLAALLPLALAAASLVPVWGLTVGATAAALLLVEAARRPSWAERGAALEAAVLVALGTLAGYAMALGVPPPITLSTALAGVLLVGTSVVAWAGAAGETREAPGLRGRLEALRWDRALALGIVILGIALGKSASFFAAAIPYTWLAASGSYSPLFLLCLLCLPGGRVGRVTSAIAMAGVLAAAVWDFASTEVVLTQAEPLTWADVLVRLEDPASLQILAGELRSWRAALLVTGVVGGFAALSGALRRLGSRASFWTLARMVGLTLVTGYLLFQGRAVFEPRMAERYLTAASAPWSPVHLQPSYEHRLDLEAARAARLATEPPIWEDGPAPLLPQLAGRYAGRSVVLVMLESHRASEVDGFGEGAHGHQPSSPRLAALANDGVSFTNYFQASRTTRSALWAALTGLPHLSGRLKPTHSGPEAAGLGRMPDFAALGYQCDWMCPTSTRFDNWYRVMQEAGVRYWVNPPETADLERTYWTAWGMPDADLMRVALGRLEAVTSTGQPLFLGLLTVSNHSPYTFPDEIDGVALTRDLRGGMRYADHAMGWLVDALRDLPEARRPIVFVTADTTDSEGLLEAEPMGTANLEGLRIPGLLLLPDGALSGERYDGLFSHEDVLDLLYLLVAPDVSSPKFVSRHRAVASSTGKLLTEGTYFDPPGERFFEIASRWGLLPTEDPPDGDRLRAAQRYYDGVRESLWRGANDPARADEDP